MENCFMIRSSPATAMLMRFRWLMKQSAMSKATIRQRTGAGWLRAESIGGFTGVQSSKPKVQSSKEFEGPNSNGNRSNQRMKSGAWSLLAFGIWCFSSSRLRDPILFDELVVQRDAQAGTIGRRDPAVLGLKLFVRQFVAHR